MGRRDGGLRCSPGRVDDPDEREHGHAVKQWQQVGRRVEGLRLEVLAPGRQHA